LRAGPFNCNTGTNMLFVCADKFGVCSDIFTQALTV
jgi:hypothetical protein